MNDAEIIQCMRDLLHIPRREFKLAGAPPPWSPPATIEQLLRTQRELGFALPRFLKQMYSEVANGGFGPAYGFMSATDEEYAPHLDDVYIVAFHRMASGCDLSEAWRWPDKLISIADNGCGMRWCLDCDTGEIVFFAGDTIDLDDAHTFQEAFIRTGRSLQEGVEDWLTGKDWNELITP
ncbi:MAG: SMI1/KNR4 family protein [Verrucomicrobiota bacterium]